MRSDVAIARKRAPEEGAPDAFGAARLLYEKTAGRSCRRRARPTFHSTTGVTALQRAPSDKGPRPTGNLPLLDRPPAAASGSSEDVACAYGISPFATDLRRRPSGPKRLRVRLTDRTLAVRRWAWRFRAPTPG